MELLDDQYSEQNFNAALRETIKKLLFNEKLAPQNPPKAFLLGGQSGAGKNTLHRILKTRFYDNVIIINGDEYRRSHPHFAEIQDRYGMDAPTHAAKWAGQMTEALINAFSEQNYNLIIEGALRTSSVTLNTATLLRGRGYGVSLAIMAVKPEISLVSCQVRYEMMRLAGTTPRATDHAHNNKIIEDIVSNLETLESSGLFDEIIIYNRAETRLYPTEEDAPLNRSAKDALSDAIFGPWTAEEKEHFKHLQQQLALLKAQ